MSRYRYLLGDARRERARLRHQARVWDPTALALFDRLKIRRGWRVLEIGPGQGSLDAELRRRVRGPVDVVEPSPAFADGIRRLSKRDGLGDGHVWQCHLIDAPLPPNTYDLIFARWVFLFLPDPEAHIRKLAAALKPGGRLAIEDYSRWTLRMTPEPPEWENFLKADAAFFATQGGDANIGARLPQLYAGWPPRGRRRRSSSRPPSSTWSERNAVRPPEGGRYARKMKYTAPMMHKPAHRKSSLIGCFMYSSANGTNTVSEITSCRIFS